MVWACRLRLGYRARYFTGTGFRLIQTQLCKSVVACEEFWNHCKKGSGIIARKHALTRGIIGGFTIALGVSYEPA
jgi:hypothetical protein